jgi:MoaA/NifB/PqqE/SkfB family radical SAM enzyme
MILSNYYDFYANQLRVNGPSHLYSKSGTIIGNINTTSLEDIKQTSEWQEVKDFTYLDIPLANVCNLACPSCRPKIISKHSTELNIDFIYEQIYKLCLESRIISGATGDFFANPYMMKTLQRIPEDNDYIQGIEFHTNGTLVSEKTWNRLHNIYDKYISFFVSVDGWTKETYEENRYPAKFEIIQKRLQFMSQISRENKYRFIIIMVVQVNNFREIPKFLEACDYLGAEPRIKLISNWNTFTPEEFKKKCVHDVENPNYNEFMDILKQNNISSNLIHACSWNDVETQFLKRYKDE